VVVLDREMRVTAWNEGAQELWGLRPDEVQGRHFLNLDIGLPVEELRSAVRAQLAGNDRQDTLELVATDRRGRAIACQVRVSSLVADGELPRGVIVFMETADA
jgi:two-component system CheB/CheR fusion protein